MGGGWESSPKVAGPHLPAGDLRSFLDEAAGEPSRLMMPSHDSAAEMFVTVRFSDGHRHRWRLPATQTADEALEELRQVITGGQWFRIPGSTRAYSPYSIVTVEVAAGEPGESEDSFARRLGEAVGDVVSPDA